MIRYTIKHIERSPDIHVYADRRRGYTFPSKRTARYYTTKLPCPEPETLADLSQDLIEVCNNFRFMDEKFENITDFFILIYHYHETGARKSDLCGIARIRLGIHIGDDIEYRQLVLTPNIPQFRVIRQEYFFEVKGIEFPEPKLMPDREFNVYYAELHRERYPSFMPLQRGMYDKESQNVAREESLLYPLVRTTHYGLAELFPESEELVKPHGTYESKYH